MEVDNGTKPTTPKVFRNKDEDKVYVKPDKLLPFFQMGEELRGHSDEVTAIYVEPKRSNGKIYSASLNGEIIVWDRETKKEISRLSGGVDGINTIIAADPFIYTAGDDKTVCIWNRSHASPISVLKGHTGWVNCLAIDEEYIYSGSFDATIRVWKRDNGELIKVLEGHKNSVNALLFDKSTNSLYSASSDQTIIVWNKGTWDKKMVLEKHTDSVTCLCADEHRVYSGSMDKTIVVWDKATGTAVKTLRGHTGFVYSVGVQNTKEIQRIYSCSYDGSIQTWHAITGQNVQNLRRDNLPTKFTCMSVEGDTIFAGLADSGIQTWRTVPGNFVHKLTHHTSSVKSVVVDETQFYSCSVDKTIRIYDKKSRELTHTLRGHDRAIRVLFVSEDRLYSGAEDKTLKVWNKKTGELIYTFPPVISQTTGQRAKAHKTAVNTIFVDEGRIYTGSDEHIYVIDKVNFQQKLKLKPAKDFKDIFAAANYNTKTSYGGLNAPATIRSIVVREGRIFVAYGEWVLIYDKTKPEPTPVQCIRAGAFFVKEDDSSIKSAAITTLFIDSKHIYVALEDGGNIIRYKKKWVSERPEYENLPEADTQSKLAYVDPSDNKEGRKPRIVTFKSKSNTVNSIYVAHGKVFLGTHEGIIEIRSRMKPNTILQNLVGHESWVYSLYVDEGKVYSGSFDKTIRIWEIDAYEMLAFFKQCMAFGTIYDHAAEYMNIRDESGRTAIMACARAGSIQNATALLKLGCNYNLNYTSDYGESALFFALRAENWDFLIAMGNMVKTETPEEVSMMRNSVILRESFRGGERPFYLKQEHLTISKKDTCSMELLRNRAIAGDVNFFINLKKTKVRYEEREILATAIKHNHTWFSQHWRAINETFALHEACFYGRPDCVKILLTRKAINIKLRDPVNENRSVLHLCHLTGNYSELHWKGRPRVDDPSMESDPLNNRTNPPTHDKAPKKTKLYGGYRREWVPNDVFNRFEYELVVNRTECFKLIAATEEITKRPDFRLRANDGKTPYDQALQLHEYTMSRMRVPRKEIQDRDEIQQNRRIFADSSVALDYYHTVPEVKKMRNNYANLKFCKETALYLAFLVILTAVGIMNSTNLTSHSYQFSAALKDHFLGDEFEEIDDVDGFWEWMEEHFIEALYDNVDEETNQAFALEYNLIIGDARLRQIKVRDDSCKIRSLYEDEIEECFAASFSSSIEDKETFGLGEEAWQYNANPEGPSWWAPDGATYGPGGFILDIPLSNRNQTEEELETLMENEWITPGTRMVFINLAVYSANLNGAFANVLIAFKFTAVGNVEPLSEVSVLMPSAYNRDINSGAIIKIIMQFLVVIYIFYAFILQELREIRQSIEEKREFMNDLPQHIREQDYGTPIYEGLKAYWSQAWNYYEWTIILIFIAIVALEIEQNIDFGSRELRPDAYTNIQTASQLNRYQSDLLALFILMNWVRLLKYLRIPPFSGPMVQSIMDTLGNKGVIVFVTIIFYVIITFALSFHISFGPDDEGFANLGDSIISLFQVLFGEFDYEPLEESNKVFGPLLFVLFMLFTVLVLLNLLIGVLGEAYNSIQEVNEARWNRFITRLMIESLEERCVPLPPPGTPPKRFSWATIMKYIKGTTKLVTDIELVNLRIITGNENLDLDADENNANEKAIYYEDDELDEMVTTVSQERSKAQDKEDRDELDKQILQRIENLEEKQKQAAVTYEKNLMELAKQLQSLQKLILAQRSNRT